MEYRAYLMRLKQDKINDYVEVHKKEKIWKSIIDGMIGAGFTKMIIFRNGQDLIAFEEAKNLKEAYSFLDKDPESARWEKMINEWMEVYPHFNEIKGDIEFIEIPVVFYYENGKLLHN
jgi:L-rhamnose mutarotase